MKKYNFSKKVINLLLILLILFFLIYCFTNLDNNYLITETEGFAKKKRSTSNKYSCNPSTVTYSPFFKWLKNCSDNNKNAGGGIKCMTNSYAPPDQNTFIWRACKCLDAKYESETIANKKESSFVGCKIDDKCSNNKIAMRCFDDKEVKNGEADDWTMWPDYDNYHNAECFPVKKSGIINRIKRALGMDGDETCNVPSDTLKEANNKKAAME